MHELFYPSEVIFCKKLPIPFSKFYIIFLTVFIDKYTNRTSKHILSRWRTIFLFLEKSFLVFTIYYEKCDVSIR